MKREDLEKQFANYDDQKGFVSRWMQKLFGFETNPRIRWLKGFVRSKADYGDKFVIPYIKFKSYIMNKMESSRLIKRLFSQARVEKDKSYSDIIQKWKTASEDFEKKLGDYPEPQTSSKKETKLDFKTECDPNKRMTARKIFPGAVELSVSLYRNQVFPAIESVNGVDVIAKAPQQPIEESFKNVPVSREVNSFVQIDDYCYGCVKLALSKSSWQPLPSLSATDKLKALTSSEPVEVKYSPLTNLYYLRLLDDADDGTVLIKFNVEARQRFIKKTKVSKRKQKLLAKTLKGLEGNDNDKNVLKKLKKKLSQKDLASALTNYCRDFTSGELSDGVENSITKIIKEQKGVCRHRAIAYRYLASKLDVNCRLIQNDIHQYVEVKLNNEWFRLI